MEEIPQYAVCRYFAAAGIIPFTIFVIIRDNLTAADIDSQLNLDDAHTHDAIVSIQLRLALAVSIAIMSVVFIETALDLILIEYKFKKSKNILIQYILLAGSSVGVIGSAIIMTYCVPGKHVMAYWYIACFTQAFLASCSFDMALIVADWNRYGVVFCSALVTVSHILRAIAVTNCARSYTINIATALASLALLISLASFTQYLKQLKTDRKITNIFLMANISGDESVPMLTQIVSILYCVELIIRSSQYGPFCARHLSPELASGWQYASSLLFLILSLGNSRFQRMQVNNNDTYVDRKLSMQVSNWNQEANVSNTELKLYSISCNPSPCDEKEDSSSYLVRNV